MATARRPSAGRPRRRGRSGSPAPAPAAPLRRGLFARRRSVPGKVLAQFTAQLATLVEAGLPLVRCLRVLEGQHPTGPFRAVLEAVADDVEGGAPLSEALAKYPDVFDRLYVNMVRAGEAGGVLGTILDRLASFSQKSEHIRSQIRSALTYPVLVLCFAAGILTFVMLAVVPKFEEIFDSFGAEMPLPTVVVMAISRSLASTWYAYLAVPLLGLAAMRLALRNDRVALRFDRLKLALPFAGDLQRKTIVARFARTLGTLLTSGVPILEALAIVKAAIPNRVLEAAVGEVHDSIREGETIARPLGESGVFDDMVVNMIDVGEETGRLDAMLLRVADNFERDVDTSVTTLFKVSESVLLLVVAVVVGGIVISLFLPIVRIMDTFATGG